MDDIIKLIITVLCSVMASSGFWLYLQRVMDRKCAKTEMLRGLGHDRIMRHGIKYIRRGYITTSEYENLKDYLYIPYKKLGGNGSADRIMNEVEKIELRE